jgi:hypothetical protein
MNRPRRNFILKTLGILALVVAWLLAAYGLNGGAKLEISTDLDHRPDLPIAPTDPNGFMLRNQEWIDTHPCGETGSETTGARDRCQPR